MIRTTALVIAVLSAQIPAPYEAFSTLAPVNICPVFVTTMQPTLLPISTNHLRYASSKQEHLQNLPEFRVRGVGEFAGFNVSKHNPIQC